MKHPVKNNYKHYYHRENLCQWIDRKDLSTYQNHLRFLQELEHEYGGEVFSSKEAFVISGKSESCTRRYLRMLLAANYLEKVPKKAKGNWYIIR